MVKSNIRDEVYSRGCKCSLPLIPVSEINDYPPTSVKTYWILRGSEKEFRDEKKGKKFTHKTYCSGF